MRWTITHKGDEACRALADRHYTRQTVGSPQFCRPGRNLVLRTKAGDALWVTWDGFRKDGAHAWECTIFRNESPHLSSELVAEAVALTIKTWGPPPPAGFLTYVKAAEVRSTNPGYCYLRAGWFRDGHSKRRGFHRLRYIPPGQLGFGFGSRLPRKPRRSPSAFLRRR